MTITRETKTICQNCQWKGKIAETALIDDLWERVAPGEPMPAGQCPNCGMLCHLDD